MLKNSCSKFGLVQVQTIDGDKLNEVLRVLQNAKSLAVLYRMALQSNELQQRDDSKLRAFKTVFLGVQLHALENVIGNEHEVYGKPRLRRGGGLNCRKVAASL
jgi:hypothetical protein